MTPRYLDDFAPRQKFGSGRLVIDKQQITAFAAEIDPQPFHLDERAASQSMFQGLAASGYHAAALNSSRTSELYQGRDASRARWGHCKHP